MKLKIDNIQAKDLFDTGTPQDPQDPVLRIVIGGQELFTKRHVDGGTEALFSDTFEVEIDEYEYKDGKLEIEVEVINVGSEMNAGSNTKNLHIGSGRAVVRSIIPSYDNEAYFIIDLTHYSRKGNYRKGEVLMRGFIHDPEAMREALKFKTIELENLKKSYEDYIVSSKQLEAEMEMALEKADAKIQKLNKKQQITTERLTEVTERYTQISTEYTHLQTELVIVRENTQSAASTLSQQQNQELAKKVATLTTTNEALQARIRSVEADSSTLQNELDELYSSKYELELMKNDEISRLRTELEKAKSSSDNTEIIVEMTDKMDQMAQELQTLRATKAAGSIVYNNTFITNSSVVNNVVNNSYFETVINSTNITNVYVTNLLQNGTDIDLFKNELVNQMRQVDSLTSNNAKLLSRVQNLTNNMLVCVRTRPPSDTEVAAGGKVCIDASDSTALLCYDKSVPGWQNFGFDRVWGIDATQQDLFNDVEPLVAGVALEGINSCVIAYGESNSGKSFSLSGFVSDAQYFGLRLRSLQKIFELLNNKQSAAEIKSNKTGDASLLFKYAVEMSFFEVKAEQIHDLLAPAGTAPLTTVQFDAKTNSSVIPNLTAAKVVKATDAMVLVSNAIKDKATASTSKAAVHTLLSVTVTTQTGSDAPVKSTLYLVDLAASEFASSDLSLNTFQKVLSTLQQQTNKTALGSVVVPYENSKLTSILRNALGGVSKTVLVLTVNPTDLSIKESLANLAFVSKLRGNLHLENASGKNIPSGSEGGANPVEVKNLKTQLQSAKERYTLLEATLRETSTTASSLIDQWKAQYFDATDNAKKYKDNVTSLSYDLNLTHRNLKRLLEQFREQCVTNERLLAIIRIYETELAVSARQEHPKLCTCAVLENSRGELEETSPRATAGLETPSHYGNTEAKYSFDNIPDSPFSPNNTGTIPL